MEEEKVDDKKNNDEFVNKNQNTDYSLQCNFLIFFNIK